MNAIFRKSKESQPSRIEAKVRGVTENPAGQTVASRSGFAPGSKYFDAGWVLDTNKATLRLIERCGGVPSKVSGIYEKALE